MKKLITVMLVLVGLSCIDIPSVDIVEPAQDWVMRVELARLQNEQRHNVLQNELHARPHGEWSAASER